ncbi:hypothetical protein R5R35_014172 [Gryllus longicercus]|uniref:Uncharacterized protein n=1 Tax=Gryllus longicercus TaxID=2509291 RepID=A0AAN9Z5G7_9ORTH
MDASERRTTPGEAPAAATSPLLRRLLLAAALAALAAAAAGADAAVAAAAGRPVRETWRAPGARRSARGAPGAEDADADAPPVAPDAPTNPRQLAASERRLSAQLRALIAHYQQEDPVGIPGAPVPDPMPVPDSTRSVAFATVTVNNASVYGLSRFRVDRVMLDLANLSASISVRLEHLDLEGAYGIRYFLTNSKGRITVTLDNVTVAATAALAVAQDGRLRADHVLLDVAFDKLAARIENEALSALARGVLEGMAPFVYESAKPFVMSEARQKVLSELDARCAKLPQRFPNSLSPLDLLVWDARKLVAHMGFDPYPVPDYNYSTGLTSVRLSNVWLSGLSTFHRAGAARVGFEKHVFRAALRVGTARLAGQCHWAIDFAGYLSRAGAAHFSVEYVEALAELRQPLDTRHHPHLERFELQLGDFAVRVAGAGTLDYAAEALANVLPNLLRSHIRDTLQRNVEDGVREALNKIDMQTLVEERLSELDEMQAAAEEMDAEADIFEALG